MTERAADALAVVPGLVLQAVFGAAGVLRPAPKPLHPTGVLRAVTIRRHGLPDDQQLGLSWLDEPGVASGVARFSRATGLPAAMPDIYGLAVRVRGAGGGHADILLATTGLGPAGRFILAPARRGTSRAYTTLLPYRAPTGPVLLAVIPRSDDPQRFDLACARPTGQWHVFGVMEVDPTDRGATGDTVSFDPIVNRIEGLAYYSWATRLREGAYRAARRSRGGHVDR